MQVKDFAKFLKRSKIDALIWLATFLTVVIVAIDIGLLVGVILSVFFLLATSLKSHSSVLGQVSGTDFYLDIEKFDKSIEIPMVKIYRHCGVMNFATKDMFKNQLCKKIGVNLVSALKKQEEIKFKWLILDFSALSQIDAPSVLMLNNLIKNFNELNIKVLVVATSSKIFEALNENNFPINVLHPTIHDAVSNIKASQIYE